jgi:hypothetical protein
MVAIRSELASFSIAAFRLSLAARSSSSAFLRSVMSVRMPTMPPSDVRRSMTRSQRSPGIFISESPIAAR